MAGYGQHILNDIVGSEFTASGPQQIFDGFDNLIRGMDYGHQEFNKRNQNLIANYNRYQVIGNHIEFVGRDISFVEPQKIMNARDIASKAQIQFLLNYIEAQNEQITTLQERMWMIEEFLNKKFPE